MLSSGFQRSQLSGEVSKHDQSDEATVGLRIDGALQAIDDFSWQNRLREPTIHTIRGVNALSIAPRRQELNSNSVVVCPCCNPKTMN
jgi:hypothetical protein